MDLKLPQGDSESRERWLSSNYTQRLAKSVTASRRDGLKKLLAACRSTSDTTVIRAFDQYQFWTILERLVTDMPNDDE